MPEAIARLIELDDHGQAVRSYELGFGTNILGRGADADIRIRHNDVSRHHAELELTSQGGVIRDLGSKNGLRLNGVKLADAEAPLDDGVRVTIGKLELRLEHTSARVDQLLVNSGDITVRRPSARPGPGEGRAPLASSRRSRAGLLVPVLASLVFGLLLLALVVYG